MSTALRRERSDGTAIELAITDRTDGDFHIDSEPAGLTRRRAAVMPGEWAVVRQVHGSHVAEAAPGECPEADGVYTASIGQPIAVQGADCAPIALYGPAGPIGVVHAGWRGLAAGVIGSMAETLRSLGGDIDTAIVGPVIGAACYEFGQADLDVVAQALGDHVRARTPLGTPAMDMRAGIEAACADVGIGSVEFVGGCTACEWDGFSYRHRQDASRHALAARIVPMNDGND